MANLAVTVTVEAANDLVAQSHYSINLEINAQGELHFTVPYRLVEDEVMDCEVKWQQEVVNG